MKTGIDKWLEKTGYGSGLIEEEIIEEAKSVSVKLTDKELALIISALKKQSSKDGEGLILDLEGLLKGLK